MTFRHIARVGAAGLMAAGIVAAAAVPAYAAEVDFGVGLKTTTIAADANGKLGFVHITNNGSTTPAKVNLIFDVTKLDQSKVVVPEPGDCTYAAGIADCPVPTDWIPGPGSTGDVPIPLVKQAGATGAAGQLTITVVVAGDTNKANDSKTVDVSVGGHGVDLGVVVPDVTLLDTDEIPTGKPIPPGGSSAVQGIIINQGDATATGLHVTVALPKDVTFPDSEGCTLSADKRAVDCVADDLPLTPAVDEPSGDDTSVVAFIFPVTVSADAQGPVTLTGGEATVAATGQESLPAEAARKLARRANLDLPKGFHRATKAQLAVVDVDASDNTDGFAVLVAGKPGGSTGGSTGGNGGGTGGGLPVTGPVAASVAGAGAVAIAIGAFLFVVTRRRRVVLVTPADEN
jgi:hypothetical protein